jgi:hypothetical protein
MSMPGRKKQRLSVYLDPDIMKRARTMQAGANNRDLPDRRGRHRVLPVAGRRRAAGSVRRQAPRPDRSPLNRMERDIGISVETWPCSSASGSPPRRRCRSPQPRPRAPWSAKRYEAFVAALGRRSPRDRNCGRRSLKMSASRSSA